MSVTDNLRLLRVKAFEARRRHIAQTLGKDRVPASAERLPGLQRMIAKVNRALDLSPAADGDPAEAMPRR